MARKKKEIQRDEPGIGDNSKKRELTEDERRILLYSFKAKCAQHDKEIEEAKSLLSKAKAGKKATLELAKSEYGVDAKADIEELMILEQPHAGTALKAEIERKLRLARWANVPEGFQASMFEPDRRPATDIAKELGKTAGLAGDVCKPPYDPSVPQYQEWLDGYHVGQTVSMAFLKTLEPGEGAQMDLSERKDLGDGIEPGGSYPVDDESLVMSELPPADVGNPPFNPVDAPQMPDTPQFLRRVDA